MFAATGGLLAVGVWRTTASMASPTTLGQSVAAAACALSAEQEEGPFYVDLDLVRSDLREDQVGIPLALSMTVLDSTTCQPLPNTAVDIWSANMQDHVYSSQSGSLSQLVLSGNPADGFSGSITLSVDPNATPSGVGVGGGPGGGAPGRRGPGGPPQTP